MPMAVVENITVLFTDLVGSTELAASLSPEVGDEVLRGHFSVLRRAIAETDGTEVKSLGDGIMVVFSTASAALSCAVAMQQMVDWDNRSADQPLGLRVGLSTGEALREADDYYGDPVIEAARLCAKAEGGQILAADSVRVIAGRRNRHGCHPVGPLRLKGLPEPVETVSVVWEPLSTVSVAPVPLPARLGLLPEFGVIGRAVEATTIAEASKRVEAGAGREILLVSGEAGQGKTTLVADAARRAFEEGVCVLFGHSEEDVARPYQLFAEALSHYVTHASEELLLSQMGVLGSELAGLVPALTARIPGLPPSKATDSDSERYLMFASVVSLLARISEEQPVVLVLDDLQWADTGSLQLLRHLVASELQFRVLVLATYRDSELSHASALVETLGALRRQHGVTRIELGGLNDDGVVSLIESASGQTLDDDGVSLAHSIYRETDGNPFFVGEVLRHLAETGAIYRDQSGRWAALESLADTSLPDGVREVIGARVVRLGGDAQRILSLAAVIGRDFDLDLVMAASRSTEDEVLNVLDEASAAALVRELEDTPGRYSFAHALIQRTVYEDLGPTRRARSHRRVAEALEEACAGRPGDRVGELARHWLSATQAQDLDKALDYSRQAADAALASLAPEDAVRYYVQAIELFAQLDDPDSAVALELGIGLGIAQRQIGDPAFRETLLETGRRAADLGDTARLTRAITANDRGMVNSITALDVDKVELLELALSRLPEDHPDRAILLATWCSDVAFTTHHDDRLPYAEESIALAEATGDDTIIVRIHNQVALSSRSPQFLAQSLARSADALVRAERIGDPVLLFVASAIRQVIAANNGDVEEVDRCLALSDAVVNRLGQPTLAWAHNFLRATRAQIAGDVDQAEEFAKLALEYGSESGEPDAALLFGSQFIMAAWQGGTAGELVPLIEQAAADNPRVTALRAGLAVALLEQGDLERAQRLVQEAAAGFERPGGGSWLTEMTLHAETALECESREVATILFECLAPWAAQFSTSGFTAEGPVSHYLGGLATVLKRRDEAESYFAASAEMCARIGAKFFAARTNLKWGQMLIGLGSPDDAGRARDLLATALNAARANGYASVERRAAEELRLMDEAGLV